MTFCALRNKIKNTCLLTLQALSFKFNEVKEYMNFVKFEYVEYFSTLNEYYTFKLVFYCTFVLSNQL